MIYLIYYVVKLILHLIQDKTTEIVISHYFKQFIGEVEHKIFPQINSNNVVSSKMLVVQVWWTIQTWRFSKCTTLRHDNKPVALNPCAVSNHVYINQAYSHYIINTVWPLETSKWQTRHNMSENIVAKCNTIQRCQKYYFKAVNLVA